jgi:hypothetical protein
MPLLILTYLVQIACAVHAFRRGYNYTVIMMILVFPVIGSLIYVVAVLLPELRKSRAAHDAARSLRKTIDPDADVRARSQAVEISDTVDNRLKLGDELMEVGQFGEAVKQYESALDGIYEDDPGILEKVAGALFAGGRFQDTKLTLEYLKQKNPDYQSQEGHLLYARAAEANGETDEALSEYDAVGAYYVGYEAKYRHGLCLKCAGHDGEARQLFAEIDRAASIAPHRLTKEQREFAKSARRELGELA